MDVLFSLLICALLDDMDDETTELIAESVLRLETKLDLVRAYNILKAAAKGSKKNSESIRFVFDLRNCTASQKGSQTGTIHSAWDSSTGGYSIPV